MRSRRVLVSLTFIAAAWLHPAFANPPNLLWETATRVEGIRLYPGMTTSGERVIDVAAVDSQGDLFVVGSTYLPYASTTCMFTAKYERSDGREIWRRSACGPGGTSGYSLAVDRAGDVIVTGVVVQDGADPYRLVDSSDILTVKYRGIDGGVTWSRRYSDAMPGERSRAVGIAVVADAEGNVFVIGNTTKTIAGIIFGPRSGKVIKYGGADGAMLWIDNEHFDVVTAMAIDPAGNVAAAGTKYVDPIDKPNARIEARVVSYRGSNGVVRWQAADGGTQKYYPAGLALDSRGNVLVTGVVDEYPAPWRLRTLKLAAESGAVLWESSISSNLSSNRPDGGINVHDIASDADGNAIITGAVGDMNVVKLSSADGRELWRQSFPVVTPGGWSQGRSIALDGEGNAIVVGSSDGGSRLEDMRATKYAARDGAELWSVGRDLAPKGGVAEGGYGVIAVPEGVYVIALGSEETRAVIRVLKYGLKTVPPEPTYQGLWWGAPANSESGWGVNLTHQGDVLFATWFTYNGDGSPMWLVMPSGAKTAERTYTGALYRATGPAFNASPWNPDLVVRTQVGQATFAFDGPGDGTFAYVVNGKSQSKRITRLIYSTPVRECIVYRSADGIRSYQDLYWNFPAGSESGWGLNVAHQGDILFATWFTYGPDGRGTWFSMPNMARQSDGSYAGEIYRSTGPAFDAQPWDPSQVLRAPAGKAVLRFQGENLSADFAYVVDGESGRKSVTRYVFAEPGSYCR